MTLILMMSLNLLAFTLRAISADSALEELGKGVNLRKTNILDDFQERQASLFESLPSSCFIKKQLHDTGSTFDYYTNTKSFYSKIALGAGLGGSLMSFFALGATLKSVVHNVGSQESKVSGISLNVQALREKVLVKKDCLDNEHMSTLKKNLVEDLERLPLIFEKPWFANSWKQYDVFLNKYGSHVITSFKRGARMFQTIFTASSTSYSQRNFEVRSCVKLAGPTNVAKVGVDICANVTKSEIANVTKMNTEDKLVIRGGSKKTRNALRTKRTEKLMEEFLNEANETEASVGHTFRSLWDILQSRFQTGSDNYIRAVNLQYYYLGYLNYGCRFKESGDVSLQKFDYTRGSSKESPEFECTLAAAGCRSDDDCHVKLGWCSCKGKSCIQYKLENQGTAEKKTNAYVNTDEDLEWHGCDWKVPGLSCSCYNDNVGSRKEVWRMPSRDDVHKSGVQRKVVTPLQSKKQTKRKPGCLTYQ